MFIQYKKNGRTHLYCDDDIPVQKKIVEEELKNPFESCGSCKYASHGFFCFREEGDCLKTALEKSQKKNNKLV